jgi:hypothetical protein
MFFGTKKAPSTPSVHELRQQSVAKVNAAIAAAIDAKVDLRQLANLLEDHVETIRMRDATTRPLF